MRTARPAALIAFALAGSGLLLAPMASAGGASSATRSSTTTTTAPLLPTTTTTYQPSSAFDPSQGIPAGSTDNYHCTLIDPGLTQDSFVVASQLLPDQVAEIHHAILFLVNPGRAATARALDASSGGHGWTCFGSPLNPSGSFDGTPWLGAWGPGRGATASPTGTGISMPAGSLIVMQIHYNLLHGSSPDASSVQLTTTPQANSHLSPLSLDTYAAPPDLPCPKGVTGALCDRAASMADLNSRFGPAAAGFVNALESICQHDPSVLKPGPPGKLYTTTCFYPVSAGTVIRSVTPHMHLLGSSAKVQLVSPSKTITLASVAHYNFDFQASYPLAKPVVTTAGQSIKVSCSYDPSLRQRLPELQNLPPRYVTWGDGSSDEMCLAIVAVTH